MVGSRCRNGSIVVVNNMGRHLVLGRLPWCSRGVILLVGRTGIRSAQSQCFVVGSIACIAGSNFLDNGLWSFVVIERDFCSIVRGKRQMRGVCKGVSMIQRVAAAVEKDKTGKIRAFARNN